MLKDRFGHGDRGVCEIFLCEVYLLRLSTFHKLASGSFAHDLNVVLEMCFRFICIYIKKTVLIKVYASVSLFVEVEALLVEFDVVFAYEFVYCCLYQLNQNKCTVG